MCQISTHLKLCTCAPKDPSTLKHYWILKRPHNREEFILGEVMLPSYLDPEEIKHNEILLLNLLNTGTCFDVVLDIREKDILELHFSCRESYLVYAFQFSKGHWQLTEYDPFANIDGVEGGKIIRPFNQAITKSSEQDEPATKP